MVCDEGEDEWAIKIGGGWSVRMDHEKI